MIDLPCLLNNFRIETVTAFRAPCSSQLNQCIPAFAAGPASCAAHDAWDGNSEPDQKRNVRDDEYWRDNPHLFDGDEGQRGENEMNGTAGNSPVAPSS